MSVLGHHGPHEIDKPTTANACMNYEHSLEPLLFACLLGLALIVTVVLWTMNVPPEGFAFCAAIIAAVGWRQCVDRDGRPSPMQKRLKPWFLGVGILLLPVVLPACFRELKGGGLGKVGASLWRRGASIFGKTPPLDIRLNSRTESSGKETVEYLIITNTFRDGVVLAKGALKRGESLFPLALPPVIKPYETIEVRLQHGRTKFFLERGDILEIECEGYVNALVQRWDPPPP